MPRLEFPDGARAPIEIGGELVVGRGASCGARLDSAYVSERHARLRSDASGAVYIEDLDSQAGTLKNGEFVYGRQKLDDGDRVKIGNIDLIFRATPAAPPPRLATAGAADRTMNAADLPPEVRRYLAERDADAQKMAPPSGSAPGAVVGAAEPEPVNNRTVQMDAGEIERLMAAHQASHPSSTLNLDADEVQRRLVSEQPVGPAPLPPPPTRGDEARPSKPVDTLEMRAVIAHDRSVSGTASTAMFEEPLVPASYVPPKPSSPDHTPTALVESPETKPGRRPDVTPTDIVVPLARPAKVTFSPARKVAQEDVPTGPSRLSALHEETTAPSRNSAGGRSGPEDPTAPGAQPQNPAAQNSTAQNSGAQNSTAPSSAAQKISDGGAGAAPRKTSGARAAEDRARLGLPSAAAPAGAPYENRPQLLRPQSAPPAAVAPAPSALPGATPGAPSGASPMSASPMSASPSGASPMSASATGAPPATAPNPSSVPTVASPYVQPATVASAQIAGRAQPFGAFGRAFAFMAQLFALAARHPILRRPIWINLVLATPLSILLGGAFFFVSSRAGFYGVLGAGCALLYFVDYACNSLTASLLHDQLTTGRASVADARARLFGALPAVLGFALGSALFDVAATWARERRDPLSRLLATLLRAIWTTATYVILPVIVVERASFGQALARSRKLMAEDPTGVGAGVVALSLVSYLFALVWFPVAWLLLRAGALVHPFLGVTLFFTAVNFYWSLSGWLKISYATCFYLWSRECERARSADPNLAPPPLRAVL